MFESLSPALQLTRFPLSAMVAASALAGYAVAPSPSGAFQALALGLGVLLLASGGTALNQVQESAVDARMSRTRGRPIPSGRLSPRTGLLIALGLIGLALLLLWATQPYQSCLLGVFTLLWYNGVYTPLKKISAFAVLPGALCGAIPPVLGWSAAGGGLADHRIVLLAGLFFLWQIPHYWLSALSRKEDLEESGLPSVFSFFAQDQLLRLASTWILALAAGTWLLFLFGPIGKTPLQFLGSLAILWILFHAARGVLPGKSGPSPAKLFQRLNIFMALIIASLLLEGI